MHSLNDLKYYHNTQFISFPVYIHLYVLWNPLYMYMYMYTVHGIGRGYFFI